MKGIKLVVLALVILLAIGSGIALAEQVGGGEPDPALSAAPIADPGTEIVAERTANSETFRLADDQLEARIYPSPINYLNAEGDWVPIGNGFDELADGRLTNGPNSFDVSLPESLGDGPVRLSDEGEWVASELLSADPEPARIEGETAVYESTDSGTSFEFSSLADGIKEEIVIEDSSQPSTFRYALSASNGLAPELVEDGSIEFRDERGELVSIVPAPIMEDSAPVPVVSKAVHYELEPLDADGWELTVAVDREWLTDPERVWPVRVDPSIIFKGGPTIDCGFKGWTGETGERRCASSYTTYQTESYYPAPPAKAYRSRIAMKFNLGAIPSTASVTETTLALHAWTAAANTSGVEVMRATRNWTNQLNWKTWDGTKKWDTEGGDFTNLNQKILTSERGSEAGWWNFTDARHTGGLRALVNGWTQGKTPNEGLIVKLIDDSEVSCTPGCVTRLIRWDSSSATEAAYRPYLSVTYYPKAPSSSKVAFPKEGTVSPGRLKLQSKWTEAGVTGISFQYRTGADTFKTIPTKFIRNGKGEEIEWPLATKGFESEPLHFDAGHATSELTEKGGDVDIRAIFEGPKGIEGYSEAAKAKIDPEKGGPTDAAASVGPGTLDLLTGNFTVSRTDVSIPGITAGLEFARSHSSRVPGVVADKTVLGRGWKPSAPVRIGGRL